MKPGARARAPRKLELAKTAGRSVMWLSILCCLLLVPLTATLTGCTGATVTSATTRDTGVTTTTFFPTTAPTTIQDSGATTTTSISQPTLFAAEQKDPASGKLLWGYIDKTGKWVIKAQFAGAGIFSEGRARFITDDSQGYKMGYIDELGHVVIKPQFTMAYAFSEGRAMVGVGVRPPESTDTTGAGVTLPNAASYGFIDASGTLVIPAQYDGASDFIGGLAPVEQGNKWGFIDQTGKVVIPLSFDDVRFFSEGLAAVESGGKWGYIDLSGAFVIKPQYESRPGHCSNGLAAVPVNGKWQYIDKTGETVIQQAFDEATEFSEGLAAVRVGDKWGFIDPSGKMAIKLQFETNSINGIDPILPEQGFHQGLAPVTVGTGSRETMEYIDKSGKVAIKPQGPVLAFPFVGPLAQLSLPNGPWMFIDRAGQVVYTSPETN